MLGGLAGSGKNYQQDGHGADSSGQRSAFYNKPAEAKATYKPLMNEDDADYEPEAAYQHLVESATDHYDVQPDAWNGMLFIVLKDLPDMMSGLIEYEMMIRVVMVVIVYLFNIVLQIGLLYWIATMVTLPAVRHAQTNYRNYRAQSFDRESGAFDKSGFNDLGDSRDGICQIALSSQLFLASLLFLFAAQCFREVRAINRRLRLLRGLPKIPKGLDAKDMVHEADSGHGHFRERKFLFCCINTTTWVAVNILIIIPKLVIAVGLCFLGCLWLAASESFGDLILNSLALVFVTEVDEMLFDVFLPPRLGKNLENLKIVLAPPVGMTEEELEAKDIHDAYSRSAFFLAATIAFVALFMTFQPVIPHFAWDIHIACSGYLEKRRLPQCSPIDLNCFPFQNNVTAVG